MMFLRRSQGLDSDTLREVGEAANVSWDYQRVIYQGRGIGWADADPGDLEAIQDAAEQILGYRPRPHDPPEQDDTE